MLPQKNCELRCSESDSDAIWYLLLNFLPQKYILTLITTYIINMAVSRPLGVLPSPVIVGSATRKYFVILTLSSRALFVDAMGRVKVKVYVGVVGG